MALIPLKEVPARYGVRPWTVRQAREAKELTVHRVGTTPMVDTDDVDRWIKSHGDKKPRAAAAEVAAHGA